MMLEIFYENAPGYYGKIWFLFPKKFNGNLKVVIRQNIYILLHQKLMKLFLTNYFQGKKGWYIYSLPIVILKLITLKT
jgi:hypothetical protein